MNTHAFAQALLDGAQPAPAGLRVPPGANAARRFAVHRNNTCAALIAALESTFPVTRALVGDAFFRAMAGERVRRDPPCSPVLSAYGAGFAAFVADYAPARGVPYLADVARLEQARVHTYHAADAAPVPLDRFAALVATPERLAATRIRLHPACVWLRSPHAARSLWQAHHDCADPADADIAHIATATPEDTLVLRPRFEVEVHALPAGAVECLDALRDGATLAAAAQHALQDVYALESLLTLIVRHGLAIALQLPDSES